MRPALTSVVLVAMFLALAGAGSAAVTGTGTIGVKIYDSRCTVAKKVLTVGERYDFVVFNAVVSRHAFKINGKKTPTLGVPPENPNMHFLPVTFAKPGRYPYQCTGTGQSKPGMKGVVVVKAPTTSGGSGSNNGGPTG